MNRTGQTAGISVREALRTTSESCLEVVDDRRRRLVKIYWLVVLLVVVILIVPIWVVTYPGMVDYPNHLARCFILAHFSDNPVWQQRYSVLHDPLPNLAIDLLVVPLTRIFSVMTSGKIFLTFAAIIYVAGCIFLGYVATGRKSWIALLAAFTFYNSALLYGFVNYIFGLGVFLIAFAFWMDSRHRMSLLRFVGCSALSLVAYLSHLSSIAFLVLSCLTIALAELYSHRRFLLFTRQLAWVIFPIGLMVTFMKGSGSVGRVEWAPLSQKAIHLLTPIRGYSLATDISLLAVLLACFAVSIGRIKLQKIAIAGCVMYFLFLITPEGLFTGSAVDARYVMPGFLLILLSMKVLESRTHWVVFTIAFLAMLFHTADITWNWINISHREQQVLQMGDILPKDSRVYVLHPPPGRSSAKRDRGFLHVVTLWTITHEAFVSTLFSSPGMQPLVARKPPCDASAWMDCLSDFDYVWTDGIAMDTEQKISQIAAPAAQWESVTLWKIRH